ncbi:MAG: tetratricopeptide repeat protein [Xenococcaceae cyanobacterium]
MPVESKSKTLQRILILVFGLAFVGSSGFFLVDLFAGDRSTPQTASTSESTSTSATEQLKAQAKGYEAVLVREPDNPVALQGLTKTRLDMQDFQGAIAPLEKLTKLYPQEQQLQALLTVVKQQANQPTSKQEQKNPNPSPASQKK